MNCIFCKIIAGELPCYKIYEDENVIAFLDIGPVSEGHTLIVPKKHAENLDTGSREDAARCMETIYEIAPKILSAIGATGYNLGMNHGAIAGQDVMHTHFHLMPRKEGDERTFVKTNPSKDALASVAEKIREAL